MAQVLFRADNRWDASSVCRLIRTLALWGVIGLRTTIFGLLNTVQLVERCSQKVMGEEVQGL